MKLMLDICSGLGGASAAMKERGWRVVTLDYNPSFNPDICEDIQHFIWNGRQPDLVWCSPPCTEFAREFMPWSKTGVIPDLSIVTACYKFIKAVHPIYWVIENVKGAIKYFKPVLGKPSYVCNPYYLWGHFPDISHVRVRSYKEHLSSTADAERARIPYAISEALAIAIEMQPELIHVEACERARIARKDIKR
jgi:hypothetical protein